MTITELLPAEAWLLTAAVAGRRGTDRVNGAPRSTTVTTRTIWHNSIIDSVPLGRLGSDGTGSFTVPAVVRRFASIDVSRQLRGTTEPSGASVLRAANPLVGAPH
ncbi:MAG: hypothetical protein ABI355_18955 [Solirubrobacteraceae bacterium]